MEAIHFYKPGKDITCHASVALTGGRAVAITGNRQSGPGLSATSEGSNYVVGLPGAGGRIFGVAGHDAALGKDVTVLRGGVVPMETAGIIAAFAEVEVDATGKVVTKAAGVAIGIACTGAPNAGVAEIALYQ